MLSFFTDILQPALNAIYVAFDAVFGWTLLFGPFTALIIAGLLTGLFVNLIQKFCSNQSFLGRSKADLAKIKELRAAAKSSNDAATIARLNSLAGRISGRYAWGSFKPALWSIPPLCVLAMWTGSRMSYEPVRPGNEVAVIAHFEDGASGFAHLVPTDGLATVGAPIAAVEIPKPAPTANVEAANVSPNIQQDVGPSNGVTAPPKDVATPSEPPAPTGPQASWKVKASKEGTYPLQIRYQDQIYNVPLPVAEKGGRPPETISFATESPNHDGLLSVGFDLKGTVDPAWWNFYQQWMGLYLIAAMVSGLALRRVLGVN